MKAFNHINATSVQEAIELLKSMNGAALAMAGGTDLLGILKDKILPEYPETIINLKTIEDLAYIKEDETGLRLGALAKLDDIAQSQVIGSNYGILADAAKTVASPQIRNLGTIGGNLCQDVRCLYYRYPHQIGGRLLCKRKGSGPCLAVKGDNRHSAIMGAKGCFAAFPSDMAVALAAMNANILSQGLDGVRSIPVEEFYDASGNVLGASEIMTGIQVPHPSEEEKATFIKFRIRDAIDFAIVSVATALTLSKGTCRHARIFLGALAPVPLRATQAETFLEGKKITLENAGEAASLAFEGSKSLSMNAYKIQIAKKLMIRSIMSVSQPK
jgi:xanthine dehydrogenase YagS FAD-binding subunit